MSEAQIIKQSTSVRASAPVLVRKKDGEVRYIVDYCQLNIKTVEQSSCNNGMRINTTKTKEMVIYFRRDRTFVDDSLPYIYMNGNYIERVS